MKDQDRGRAPFQPRKPYSAPRLRCFGDIREITRAPIANNASAMDMTVGVAKS